MKNNQEYLIFQPGLPGEIMLRITGSGEILYCKNPERNLGTFELLLSQIERGIANEKAESLIAVSTTGKIKDCLTLKQLLGKQARTGNVSNLRTITTASRYKGRNWQDPILIEQVREMHDQGMSIREIAKNLGVSPSTLTRANRRYNLYPTREVPMGLACDQGNHEIRHPTH